jgi:flavin reductase (DIM6/NTAB) family NADH-FMN oxidoreductase RutF
MIDAKKFRDVMGHFPTGVTIVTTRGEADVPLGLTVSAFTSVSLDPVLLLVCIHRHATPHDPLLKRGSFTVNILPADQSGLALRFASVETEERFRGLEMEESPLGNPLLPECLAWLDCRVSQVYPGGDHSIVLADVVDCGAREGSPLLFHRGALRGVGS